MFGRNMDTARTAPRVQPTDRHRPAETLSQHVVSLGAGLPSDPAVCRTRCEPATAAVRRGRHGRADGP